MSGLIEITNDGTKDIAEDLSEEPKEIVILEKINCNIPERIIKVLKTLNRKFERVEFSIFLKSKWNNETQEYDIMDEYFVPKQKVTAASIEYLDDNMDYNTVIHKHPNGLKTFSGVDEAYINKNFLISLLWVDNNIEMGIINIPIVINDERYLLRRNINSIKIVSAEEPISEKLLERIQENNFVYAGKHVGKRGGYISQTSNGRFNSNGYYQGGMRNHFGSVYVNDDFDYDLFNISNDEKEEEEKEEKRGWHHSKIHSRQYSWSPSGTADDDETNYITGSFDDNDDEPEAGIEIEEIEVEEDDTFNYSDETVLAEDTVIFLGIQNGKEMFQVDDCIYESDELRKMITNREFLNFELCPFSKEAQILSEFQETFKQETEPSTTE